MATSRELARSEYRAYLASEDWRQLRLAALERDGFRCRLCNSSRRLEVHHRYYLWRRRRETPDALTTLCRDHHQMLRDAAAFYWRGVRRGALAAVIVVAAGWVLWLA